MDPTQDLTWRAVEYAETCGLVVRGADCGCPSDGCYASVNHVPLTLKPTVLERSTFATISKLQLIINQLIHNASNDFEFIRTELVKVDDFWGRLYRVFENSRESKSPAWLGLHRCDYLIENNIAKMVEFNTIASSMGGHAVGISQMHRSLGTAGKNQPENRVVSSLGNGMKQAVDLFCQRFTLYRSEVCVIVLCEEGTSRNFSDQKRVELELQKQLDYEVDIYRASLSAFDGIQPDSEGRIKFREKEVALFYLRAGYDPSCYECRNCSSIADGSNMTEKSWENRLQIEKSRAIKSPSIEYHLLTNKLFQAEFAKKSVLKRYISEQEADFMLETVCHIDDLSDLNSPTVQEAKKNPSKYCLKILREGGALGNLFGEEIVPKLKEMESDPTIAKMYILMEMINPTIVENTLVRCGKKNTIDTISEVGIFGVYLFSKSSNRCLINDNDGHLVRTKPASSNVGGVNVGGACIGSIVFSQ